MTGNNSKEVKGHLTSEKLKNLIKEEQKRGKVLQRAYFINDLYEGKTVPVAAKHAGVIKAVAYIWFSRWNESGFDCLIPGFAGGKPSMLTEEQKKELKALLEAKVLRYLKDIVDLKRTKFNVEYSEREVKRIPKGFRMKHAKPYHVDCRKPKDAEEKLKKTRHY
jgi:putative transposase